MSATIDRLIRPQLGVREGWGLLTLIIWLKGNGLRAGDAILAFSVEGGDLEKNSQHQRCGEYQTYACDGV